MFKVDPIMRKTVTEQVMEKIADIITSGQVKAGEQLPNERDLAEMFGVTRGRVRESLRALALIGLITIKPGEGSFVSEQGVPVSADTIVWMFHNEIHNLDEVYAARKLIESEVYLTATGNVTDQQLTKLEEMLQTMSSIQNNIEEFQKHIDTFDIYLGEVCGNRIYAKLMQTIVHLRRETVIKLFYVPGAIESSLETRKTLITALKARDLERVRVAVDDFFVTAKRFYNRITTE